MRRRCIGSRSWTTGASIDGPALLIEPHQTIVVEDGLARARSPPARNLVLTRVAARAAAAEATTDVDPVLLEVFANQFMAIAEEMGATLQNTASSVNIKERLDFSCADVRCARAGWWPMRRICRCIWARWAIA